MLQNLLNHFRSDVAVDLGTANTLVCLVGEGLVLNEPSVVAVQQGTGRILSRGCAVGHLAKQMEGRTPDSISVVRPLSGGVITDFQLCEAMLRYFLSKAQRPGRRLRPRVLVGVPGCITPVEKRAAFNSVHRAGAGQVWLMPEARAAAIGVGLPIAEPHGQHGLRHRRRNHRSGHYEPRRHGGRPIRPHRRRPDGPGHRRLSAPPLQPADRHFSLRATEDRRRQRLSAGRGAGGRSSAASIP